MNHARTVRIRSIAIVVATILIPSLGTADTETAPRRLEVEGEAEVRSAPDVAYVRLGVVVENERAQEAQNGVNEVANRILEALRNLDVEDADLQTVELQIGPVYANEPRPDGGREPRIRGYQASNVLRVTVRDLTRLGRILDQGLAAGANRVEGIAFGLLDDTSARAEALRRAIADARSKATIMSEAADVALGPIHRLRESHATSFPASNMRMRALATEAASTPTSPGQIAVRAQVSIEYALR